MRTAIIYMLFCLVLGVAAAADYAAENNTATCTTCDKGLNASVNESRYIFIQEGSGGSFVEDGSGNYTLTVEGVAPYTIFFSDRPAKDTGFAPMQKFIDGFLWGPINPPNAAVMLKNETAESDVVVVELTAPRYDEANQTLTYRARLIKDYAFRSEWGLDPVSKADPSIPESFGQVMIAIDDCPCSYLRVGSDCPETNHCRNSCWKWGWEISGCMPCGTCCTCPR